jgi:hypothetical protein
LTDLTTADANGGGVGSGVADDLTPGGVVAISADARRVYFVAGGALVDGATAGAPNLYLWQEDGGLRLIAKLDGRPHPAGSFSGMADGAVWSFDRANGSGPRFRDARTTADGRLLLFRSRMDLTDQGTGDSYQLYLYDVAQDDLTCVSCATSVGGTRTDTELKRRAPANLAPGWLTRNLSRDGRRVFFDTADPLVADDSNGRVDVYEWEAGVTRLISSGSGSADSFFLDASEDGDHVFFTTRRRLACVDTDDLVDVYDAQLGGSALPCAAPPSCSGSDCPESTSAAPTFLAPATSSFRGRGNEPPARRNARKCRRGFVVKRVRRTRRCVKRTPAPRSRKRSRPRRGPR